MKRFGRWKTSLLLGSIVLLAAACSGEAGATYPEWDTGSDTWVATDGLGRDLPGFAEVGGPREDRFVGIFYFLWLGQHGTSGPHDITKILAQDPAVLEKPDSLLWGPEGSYHHWGEPLFGYYLSDDAWVLRKHAQMLADAGVDTLIFDVTNHFTYKRNYMELLRVFDEVRRRGGRTPQVAFLTPFGAPARVMKELFEDLYGAGLYEDLWFLWEGKPLILANPDWVDEKYRDFFTFRAPEPSYFAPPSQPAMWSWLQVYPQHVSYKEPEVPEQIAVGVGQNAVGDRLAAFSEEGTRGRSFSHHEGHPGNMSRTNFGINFAEQFERALEVDPNFIFITGWNEWVAMRLKEFNQKKLPVMFVDVFDEEYTRDIEPVNGFTKDHYYYQMTGFIRRYKGVREPVPAGPSVTIRLHDDFRQWGGIEPEFRDDSGDTAHRNHPGWGVAGPYRNETGRNDFVLAKVARDDEFIYFYVRTEDPVTPRTDQNWMWLFFNIDTDGRTGWEGYNFLVNRRVIDDERTLLEVSAGGWDWRPAGEVNYRMKGNELHLAIPRSLLGADAPDLSKPLRLDFKWADHMQEEGEILEFILHGDAAPNGRFRYRYSER